MKRYSYSKKINIPSSYCVLRIAYPKALRNTQYAIRLGGFKFWRTLNRLAIYFPGTSYVPLLLLIGLAFFLRVWRLPQTPPGLWYDEAYYAMDAAWLLDGGPQRLFFPGNNGREPIFIYLQTLFIWVFGAGPLTSRLPAPLIGTLTVPVVYVLARRLARGLAGARLLASIAAAGVAVSFWHIGLSRGGYRGILLPLVAALVFYCFWRGRQERSWRWMALAGVALGLSQYTYLAARVLPLALVLFALLWSLLNRRDRPGLKFLWLSMLLMAAISAVIFAPLGWLFYNEPALFSARTGDVLFTPDTGGELFTHLLAALRLFIDGGDPNWRHHLPGRPMLGWLGWLGFWPGLVICVAHLRRPVYLFLVTVLAALYLPALLSTPPVHALRLSAMIPIYYLIFAMGLATLARRLVDWLARGRRPVSAAVAAIVLVVLSIEMGLTMFDYFYRWAGAEKTYVEYNGPLVDFVEAMIDQTRRTPVIIPFQLYVHPTTRYLLHDHFSEQAPPDALSGPARLVTLPNNFQMLNVANIPPLPSLVWLARTPKGEGAVYVSRPPRRSEQIYLDETVLPRTPDVYRDRFGREVAHLRTIEDPTPLRSMFTETPPLRTIHLTWAGLAALTGYEVTPQTAQPGRPVTLNLYWRSLTDKPFDDRLFLQIIDSAGAPLSQLEDHAFREDMYRWRPDGLLPTQHTLWLGPETPPGAYLIRLGFFNPKTGERLPLSLGVWEQGNGGAGEQGSGGAGEQGNGGAGEPGSRRAGEQGSRGAGEPGSRGAGEPGSGGDALVLMDQVQLGLFYVTEDGGDLPRPEIVLSANFDEAIQLTGVTIPNLSISRSPDLSISPSPDLPSSPSPNLPVSQSPDLPISNLQSPISNLPITFYWRSLQPTDQPYTVFLQLLDEQGEFVTGWDSQPFNGLYPTNLWSPGEMIVDTFILPLPEAGLPPGAYRLISGFYDFETGRRLPVIDDGDSVTLATFTVVEEE